MWSFFLDTLVSPRRGTPIAAFSTNADVVVSWAVRVICAAIGLNLLFLAGVLVVILCVGDDLCPGSPGLPPGLCGGGEEGEEGTQEDWEELHLQ